MNHAETNVATPKGCSAVADLNLNSDQFCVPADALQLLEIWQTHLGSCRESCDEGGKLLWDRIETVRVQARPSQNEKTSSAVTSDDMERDQIWAELSAALAAEDCGDFDFDHNYYMFLHGWHERQKLQSRRDTKLEQTIIVKATQAEQVSDLDAQS